MLAKNSPRRFWGELGKLNLTAQEAVKPIVYALPRGGLPVAVPIARPLGLSFGCGCR